MIDLKDLRARPDHYRTGCVHKNEDPTLVDRLLTIDAELREHLTRREQLTAEKNRIGKEIGRLAGRLKKAPGHEQAALQAEMKRLRQGPNEIKAEEAGLQEKVDALQAQRNDLWLGLPQPADADVPVGRSAEDNVQLSVWRAADGFDPARSFEAQRGFAPRSHIDIGALHGWFDTDRGVRISGARSIVFRGDGMRLYQAVLRLALDTMVNRHRFEPLSAACLVKHDTMVGTGFFPHGRDQVYDVANPTSEDGLALTGTGEVGLMAFHGDEILDAAELPRRYTTVSTCFRREAGAAGRDTAGLYRVHQFDKVEQVVICRADEAESRRWHREMMGYVTGLVQSLGLPHRLLQCCTGDLGPKNADMIDIECWMPSRGEFGADGHPTGAYGETHSASRLYDYQCRRLNIRYRDPDTGKPVFCHSLNNTVAACPRLLIPLIEIHQQADGTVAVPEPLCPYLNGDTVLGQPAA